MPAARLTENEDQRLAALAAQRILDTGPDARFDGLVKLAADLFEVPIALVSLVDRDRQLFKAAVGLAARETPRDWAVCAHAILRPDEVLVVEDATRDPRFADNPLLLGEPDIRFYAGAVLRAPGGEALGTLCVIDTVPRCFSEVQKRRLNALAVSVGAMVDLHRSTTILHRAATHDALTGLANRAAFESRLAIAVEDARMGQPFALLLADLDGFKKVNDHLGHPCGDAVLVMAAQRLGEVMRAGDMVARIGGDEFAVILDGGLNSGAAANVVTRRVVETMHAPFQIDAMRVAVGISVGSALCPLDGLTERDLIKAADLALYDAKRAGGGRGVAADFENGPGARAERIGAVVPVTGRAMEAALREAMHNGELALHWQPYFDVVDGSVQGFEALLRWSHPQMGALSPAVFIPVAEACGLIAEIDRWVLRAACQAAKGWVEPWQVAVNLSAHWFAAGLVEELVVDVLAATGLAASRLEVELTERTLIANRDTACGQMQALRDRGVKLAMDDFGTGYSSLAYLRQFPFDKLKLDRSFVAPLGQDPRADDVARAIIQLGHSLHIQVCGEGVETMAQLEFLRREGCEVAQGFLLGRPEELVCGRAFRYPPAMVPVKLFGRAPQKRDLLQIGQR